MASWAVNSAAGPNRTGQVLLITGMVGFLLGVVAHPAWHVAVETAQVVAGVVTYPQDDPFLVYHQKAWHLFHQLCAIALRLGMSERALSIFLSGLAGMVSFQALGLCVFALCRDFLFTMAALMIIYVTGVSNQGVTYPVWLMGFGNTGGLLGVSCSLLTIACFGAGRSRLGAFVMGLAPCIHAAMAIYLWIGVFLAMAWDRTFYKGRAKNLAVGFMAGFLISLISFLIYKLMIGHLPALPPEQLRRFYVAYVDLWDVHRRPVEFRSIGIYFNYATVAVCAIWLRWFKADLPKGCAFMLRVFVVLGLMGILGAALTHLPPSRVPTFLLMLMPGRVINFDILAFFAIVLGLLRIHRRNFGMQIVLLGLAGLVIAFFVQGEDGGSKIVQWLLAPLLLVFHSFELRAAYFGGVVSIIFPNMLSLVLFEGCLIAIFEAVARFLFRIRPNNLRFVRIRFCFCLLLLALAALRAMPQFTQLALGIAFGLVILRFFPITAEQCGLRRHALQRLPERVFDLLLLLIAAGMVFETVHSAPAAWRVMDEYAGKDPFFTAIASTRGLVATTTQSRGIQLKTRRPILLEAGALDTLSYAPESFPAVVGILKTVYGVDFFNPPEEAAHSAGVPVKYNRKVWEAKLAADWAQIRKEFDVTAVVVPVGWKLRLPVVAENDKYLLYAIPAGTK